MTDKQIEKAMAQDLKNEYGALVSITDIQRYTKKSRSYIAKKLASAGCKEFDEGTHKQYFYMEVAEAFCRKYY